MQEIRAGGSGGGDDEDRETEGDLLGRGKSATPEAINSMAKYGRGLVCLAMTEERLTAMGPIRGKHLELRDSILRSPSMPATASLYPSAYDRARTIRVAGPATGLPIWPGLAMCFLCGRARVGRRPAPADGGGGGPGTNGGDGAGRHHLRDHARRRTHGPRPRPHRILQNPRPKCDRGTYPLPHAIRRATCIASAKR